MHPFATAVADRVLRLGSLQTFTLPAVLVLLVLVVPQVLFAEMPSQLVPCGNNITYERVGDQIQYSNECDVCDLSKLGMNVLNFLVAIMVAVAALLFVNAGLLYVTSPGNQGSVSKAHKLFTNTLFGLVIILAAYLLIDVLMKSLLGGDQLDEGRIGDFGPWNEILCIGDQNSYFIPILGSIDLKSSELVLPDYERPTDCGAYGGTCITGGATACTNSGGKVITTPSPCPAAASTCCAPQQAESTCTLATGSTGRCLDPDSCVDADGNWQGESQPSVCGNALVCCPVISAPTPESGWCSPDTLRDYFGSYSEAMSCICDKESEGDPAAPSTYDKCKDGYPFSIGLFQINLTVHWVAGLNCPSAFNGKNYDCTVKDVALYNECVNAASDPTINLSTAKTLLRSGSCPYDAWECSARKCNLPVCSNYCPL